MFDMMKKLQKAQEEMKKIKARLDTISVEGFSSEGKIKVSITGNRKIKGITFADESIMSDKDQLEDYLVIAINNAIEKADKLNETEMKSAVGQTIPGIGGLLK